MFVVYLLCSLVNVTTIGSVITLTFTFTIIMTMIMIVIIIVSLTNESLPISIMHWCRLGMR